MAAANTALQIRVQIEEWPYETPEDDKPGPEGCREDEHTNIRRHG